MSKTPRADGWTAGWSDEAIRAMFGSEGTAVFRFAPDPIPDPRITHAMEAVVQAAFALEEAIDAGTLVQRCQDRLWLTLQDMREVRVTIAAERARVAEAIRELSR